MILQYDAAIRNKSLSISSYRVEEGEIVKVYSNTSAEAATEGKDGPFVVIELKAGWSTGGNDIYPGSATVTQTADIKTTKGRKNSSVPSPDRSCRITCTSRKGRL